MAKKYKYITVFFLAVTAFLLSCENNGLKAGQLKKDTLTKDSVKATKSVSTAADTLKIPVGNYSCNCVPDATKQLKLSLTNKNNSYEAALSYEAGHFKANGILQKDTINFDKDFNVWSFTKGKKVYGFRFTGNENNGTDVTLINEDYKKEIGGCSDAKVIDFIKH